MPDILAVRRHIAVGANRTVFSPDSPTRLCRAGTYRAFLPAWRHIVVALFERQHCCFLKQGHDPKVIAFEMNFENFINKCDTCVMGTWKSKNRHKYLLQYHIIFVCRYRKKLLMSKQISDDIKQFSYEICQKIKSLSDIWRQIKIIFIT